jgi:hypothetical protein
VFIASALSLLHYRNSITATTVFTASALFTETPPSPRRSAGVRLNPSGVNGRAVTFIIKILYK